MSDDVMIAVDPHKASNTAAVPSAVPGNHQQLNRFLAGGGDADRVICGQVTAADAPSSSSRPGRACRRPRRRGEVKALTMSPTQVSGR